MTDELLPFEADHWRRARLLMLLDGATRAGLTPIEQTTLHGVAFLSNVLARLYGLPIENGLVVRWKRGPFFPDLQWDIDRLAIMGLARIHQVESVKDRAGHWFRASYELGPLARPFLEASLCIESVRRSHSFYCELFSALAAIPNGDQREAALQDATYANIVDGDLNAEQTVIDFGGWRTRNFTDRATRSIGGSLEGLRLDDRERLHLYFLYLGRRATRTRRAI